MPRTMRLPASKPRNPVVHALARLGRNGIEAVMAAQQDLVEVVHTLKQVLCVKG